MAANLLEWPSFEQRCDRGKVRSDFIERGFICVQDYLSADELERVRCELERYKLHVLPNLPSGAAFFEDKQRPEETLIRLERMLQHDDFFRNLALSSVFNGLVDCLLGVPCEPNNVQFFSKPPGAKSTPPHQDGQYFMHDQGVTLWLALGTADAKNGCMYYVPRSHKLGLLEHIRAGQLGFSQELKDYSPYRDKELCMEVDAGSLLGHHPYMVHRAGPNIDPQQRWRPALGLTFWAQDCRRDNELRKRQQAYQEQLKSELIKSGKI